VDPPDFLNYEGAEVILIGASEIAEQELGIDFRPDEETECTADVLEDLRLPRQSCASRSSKASGDKSRIQNGVPEHLGCYRRAIIANGANGGGDKDRK
jgi:hypothetical protein